MARSEMIYGIHAVRALIERSPDAVLELWILAGSHNAEHVPIVKSATTHGIHPQSASRATLDKMTAGGRHQGVVARCRARAPQTEIDLHTLLAGDLRTVVFLVLDGVEDPHNLGACLRVADAAGVSAVIRPQHRGTGVTATVAKVASGAAETVPLVSVSNLARALATMKEAGVWIIGAAPEAEKTLYQVDLTGPIAWVLGGESDGLRRLTREHCDVLARIPMSGTVESLNVSVSAGICLFETIRQRTHPR